MSSHISGFAAHASALGVISADWMNHLASAGGLVALVTFLYYAIKAVILLLAGTFAIFTKDENRRKACLEIVQAMTRGWPLPRLSRPD